MNGLYIESLRYKSELCLHTNTNARSADFALRSFKASRPRRARPALKQSVLRAVPRGASNGLSARAVVCLLGDRLFISPTIEAMAISKPPKPTKKAARNRAVILSRIVKLNQTVANPSRIPAIQRPKNPIEELLRSSMVNN